MFRVDLATGKNKALLKKANGEAFALCIRTATERPDIASARILWCEAKGIRENNEMPLLKSLEFCLEYKGGPDVESIAKAGSVPRLAG